MKKYGLGLLILGGLLALGLSGCGAGSSNFTKDVKVSFVGYNGTGYAKVSDKTSLSVAKAVATYELKKAKVDKDSTNKLLDSVKKPDDIKNEDIFDAGALTEEHRENLAHYYDHIDKTVIGFNKGATLKNGQSVTYSVQDKSGEPYFKKQVKTFKVTGLKTKSKVSVSSFGASDFNIKYIGYDGLATVRQLSLNTKGANYDLGNDFDFRSKKLSNGDTLDFDEGKLAKLLNDFEGNGKYLYTGTAGKDVSVKVTGLKKVPVAKVSNLNTILKKLADEVNEPDNGGRVSSDKVLHTYMDDSSQSFHVIYQLKSGKYYDWTGNEMAIKSGKLEAKTTMGDYTPYEDLNDFSVNPITAEASETDPYLNMRNDFTVVEQQ